MKSKLKFVGDILFVAGIVWIGVQIHYLKNAPKLFSFPFLMISVGCAMNIPNAYYELKNDWRNSLQIRKYFVGSIFSAIANFIIFIVALILL